MDDYEDIIQDGTDELDAPDSQEEFTDTDIDTSQGETTDTGSSDESIFDNIDDIEIPEIDPENVYKRKDHKELINKYPFTPSSHTVPALYTVYKGTTIPKILVASNEYNKLLYIAKGIEERHRAYIEEVMEMLDEYEEKNEIKSVEMFNLLAKGSKKSLIGFDSMDDAKVQKDVLADEGYYSVIALTKYANTPHARPYATIEIYYTDELKTRDEVIESLDSMPKMWIDNLPVV